MMAANRRRPRAGFYRWTASSASIGNKLDLRRQTDPKAPRSGDAPPRPRSPTLLALGLGGWQRAIPILGA